MQLYSFRDYNIRKTWLLFILFLIVVIGIGWVFSYVWQSMIILYIAIAISLVMNILAYYKSDKIALSISKARKAPRALYKELYNIVENLCISQGSPTPKIYIINDDSPNAFATGRNPSHSSIAVTSGLLTMLNRSETEGVIAHELSHIKNYDILLSSVIVVLVGFLAITSDIFLKSMWFRGNDDRNIGGIGLFVGIIVAILAPIAGIIIQLAISRKREYLADASGALITRYPEGLASALSKISSAPKMKRVSSSTAHLFFADPSKLDSNIKQKKVNFFSKLFMTHPPIEDRIKKLRSIE